MLRLVANLPFGTRLHDREAPWMPRMAPRNWYGPCSSAFVPPIRALAALSAVLAMRLLALKDGLSVSWPVCDGGRVMTVRAIVRRRERLSTALGDLMAWRIEPAIVGDAGELGARGLTLWLSDDNRKLPLLMEAEMPVGRFVLRLRSARG